MKKIVFFTGAGISAESGISTFRDKDGLWEKHKIEDICNFMTWQTNYDLVHKFYNERRIQLKNVVPNKIHQYIAKIQKEFHNKEINNEKIQVEIITQNVDNLLEQAGCENVLHVHGFLTEIKCNKCHNITDIGYQEFKNDMICQECGSKIFKPNIVFFYESAPNYKQMFKIFDSLTKNDILIVLGTNGNVIPINSIIGEQRYKVKQFIKNNELSKIPRYNDCIIATTILNNLEQNKYINDKNFDFVFYDVGTNVIEEIYDFINYSFYKDI